MKIFISWSGERSRQVASLLKAWLPDVFQDVAVWMSDHDLDAGARWVSVLGTELEATDFGILCLTPENLSSAWLLFEAGSLSKSLNFSRVVPYRLELVATEVRYPLAQFQGVDANPEGTFKLLNSINNERSSQLSDDRLQRLFAKWWPDFQSQLELIGPPTEFVSKRSDRDILDEILGLLRKIEAPKSPQMPEGLEPMEEQIFRLRYGVGGRHPMSGPEISRELGISYEVLRESEGKLLRKMGVFSGKKVLPAGAPDPGLKPAPDGAA
jgi:TIR domain